MMIETRKASFIKLGDFLTRFTSEKSEDKQWNSHEKEIVDSLQQAINQSIHYNGWFTKENIYFSLTQWAKALQVENIENWLEPYNFAKNKQPKKVAIIMAGNIPLVGFHDFLSVLISGHQAILKLSSNDKLLLPVLIEYLKSIESEFKNLIEITEDKLPRFDAVIATGSNNTARYFEYYFSKKPHIIRKNRNSVAILTGEESYEDLKNLAEDIFRYYGLGCRNVSKLFVPENYDFKTFFEAIYEWNPIINQHKYANNYDYNKAVYLMSEQKLFDNNFLILKEDDGFSSPIGCLFYERYSNKNRLEKMLKEKEENLQCIVSKNLAKDHIKFGNTQQPKLYDYADNVDTLAFLSNL